MTIYPCLSGSVIWLSALINKKVNLQMEKSKTETLLHVKHGILFQTII